MAERGFRFMGFGLLVPAGAGMGAAAKARRQAYWLETTGRGVMRGESGFRRTLDNERNSACIPVNLYVHTLLHRVQTLKKMRLTFKMSVLYYFVSILIIHFSAV
jgi:hypothetical protein